MSQMMKYKFSTGTEKVAVLDEHGNRTGEAKDVPVDWVEYTQVRNADGMVPSNATKDKVRRMDPNRVKLPEGADGGSKLAHMNAIWNDMLPEYTAWKEGREVPETGTALAVWTQLTLEDADVFRAAGIKTVEEVAGLNDNAISRIRLPNVHDLRKLAKMFLDNQVAATATAKEQALMDRIAALESALSNAVAVPMPNQQESDEVEELIKELEARDIAYDKRIRNPDKLRAILQSVKEEAA